jgi:thioredoxin reductase/ferredoxin
MLSEDTFVWGGAGLVVAAIVLPYLLLFRHRRGHDRGRKAEATALGIDRPVAQFPFIDVVRCIGCGSCVAACPEGDVLAVVGGSATVVNALRCVGHGRCAEACPVGAIEIGLGDLKSRSDVPFTDESYETNVPGLFVVGELGGMGLVRNAVRQAGCAIDKIAARTRAQPRAAAGTVDVAVVGAGPAGLAAAALARQRGLSHVVLEQEQDLGGAILHYPRRKLVLVEPLEIPLWGKMTREEYSKEELLGIFHELVERARLDLRFGHKVISVQGRRGSFSIEVESGAAVLGRSVVLALGRRGTPRKLGVPGEDLPKVMYRLLDAESYRRQRLLVVGGGDSAVEAAVGLARQPGNEVALSYRRDKLVRVKKKNEDRFRALVAEGKLRTLFGSEVQEILPGSVRLRTGGTTSRALDLPNDYVFVFAGGEPPYELVKRMGVRFGGESAQAGPGASAS